MLLNPILRGWAMYQRHVVTEATFPNVVDLWCGTSFSSGPTAAIQANPWVGQAAVLSAPASTRLGLCMRHKAAGIGLQAGAFPAYWATHQAPCEGPQRR